MLSGVATAFACMLTVLWLLGIGYSDVDDNASMRDLDEDIAGTLSVA